MCFFESFTVKFIFSCPYKMLNFSSQVPQRSHIHCPLTGDRDHQYPPTTRTEMLRNHLSHGV